MPTIDLNFPNPLNVSVQLNPNATVNSPLGADIIYFTPTFINGIHNTAGTIIELGPAVAIIGNMIRVNHAIGAQLPGNGDFIMFAKRRSTNMSSLLGYFAKFRIKNNSTEKAEMYSIAVDTTESSK